MRRLAVLWVLGVALLFTLVARWLGRRRGLAAFRAQYSDDGLLPVSREQRDALQSFGHCIACGLCDRGEGPRRAESLGAYPGVMTLVLASSRGTNVAQAAHGFGFVSEAVLAEKEAICPTRVPIRRLAQFVREQAAVSDQEQG